jgi:2'-5' RNA ligase
VPIDTITEAIVAAYEVASKTVPFSLSVSEVSCFPKGEDGVPIITRVESPEIHKLWRDLCTGLDRAGVDYSKKFPEFSPHVTLSYNLEVVRAFPIGPFEWTAYEMVLWGGDSGDERISVTLPFSMPGKEALRRTLVQARVRFPALV